MKKAILKELQRLAATLPEIGSGIPCRRYKGRAGRTELGKALVLYSQAEVQVNHVRRMKTAFQGGGWHAVQAYVNKHRRG